MKSRNLVNLFFTTLLIGSITTGIAGFVIRWDEYSVLFKSGDIGEIVSVLFWFLGVGAIFSILSQMGFFAYLTVHRFALGIFRSVSLWNSIQIVLIVFVLFDLVYFRYIIFGEEQSIVPYFYFPFVITVIGLIVSFIKQRQTNQQAFIPALFFMVVVTVIEWFPALRVNEPDWLHFWLYPLLLCNAYQVLILHRINEKAKGQ